MKKLFVSLLLVFFIPALASADDRLKAGTWEIGVGFESESPTSVSQPTLVPFVGYFFVDNIEGIIYAYYSSIETDIESSITSGKSKVSTTRVSGGLVYNFQPWTVQNTELVLALSGLVDYVSAEADNIKIQFEEPDSLDSLGYTVGLGIRCFLGDRSSINLENYYSTADLEYKTSAGIITEDISGFNTSISYSLYFH